MDHLPYQLQNEQPLFPKILWNRPINKLTAGRLLLVGGHSHDFVTVQEIYQLAMASGIAQCTIAMPDSLRRLLPPFDDAYFVPASPSGSIGRGATAELVSLAEETDGLSLGADLSNNSETAAATEHLLAESSRPRCLYLEALDIVSFNPQVIIDKDNSCIIINMQEFFKLADKLNIPLNIQPERGLLGRVELAQSIAADIKASLVLVGKEIIIVTGSQTSVTPGISARISSAIYAVMSVFWTQKPDFEHLTTAAFIIQQASVPLADEDYVPSSKVASIIDKLLKSF